MKTKARLTVRSIVFGGGGGKWEADGWTMVIVGPLKCELVAFSLGLLATRERVRLFWLLPCRREESIGMYWSRFSLVRDRDRVLPTLTTNPRFLSTLSECQAFTPGLPGTLRLMETMVPVVKFPVNQVTERVLKVVL